MDDEPQSIFLLLQNAMTDAIKYTVDTLNTTPISNLFRGL
jgi:hypothetical protein